MQRASLDGGGKFERSSSQTGQKGPIESLADELLLIEAIPSRVPDLPTRVEPQPALTSPVKYGRRAAGQSPAAAKIGTIVALGEAASNQQSASPWGTSAAGSNRTNSWGGPSPVAAGISAASNTVPAVLEARAQGHGPLESATTEPQDTSGTRVEAAWHQASGTGVATSGGGAAPGQTLSATNSFYSTLSQAHTSASEFSGSLPVHVIPTSTALQRSPLGHPSNTPTAHTFIALPGKFYEQQHAAAIVEDTSSSEASHDHTEFQGGVQNSALRLGDGPATTAATYAATLSHRTSSNMVQSGAEPSYSADEFDSVTSFDEIDQGVEAQQAGQTAAHAERTPIAAFEMEDDCEGQQGPSQEAAAVFAEISSDSLSDELMQPVVQPQSPGAQLYNSMPTQFELVGENLEEEEQANEATSPDSTHQAQAAGAPAPAGSATAELQPVWSLLTGRITSSSSSSSSRHTAQEAVLSPAVQTSPSDRSHVARAVPISSINSHNSHHTEDNRQDDENSTDLRHADQSPVVSRQNSSNARAAAPSVAMHADRSMSGLMQPGVVVMVHGDQDRHRPHGLDASLPARQSTWDSSDGGLLQSQPDPQLRNDYTSERSSQSDEPTHSLQHSSPAGSQHSSPAGSLLGRPSGSQLGRPADVQRSNSAASQNSSQAGFQQSSHQEGPQQLSHHESRQGSMVSSQSTKHSVSQQNSSSGYVRSTQAASGASSHSAYQPGSPDGMQLVTPQMPAGTAPQAASRMSSQVSLRSTSQSNQPVGQPISGSGVDPAYSSISQQARAVTGTSGSGVASTDGSSSGQAHLVTSTHAGVVLSHRRSSSRSSRSSGSSGGGGPLARAVQGAVADLTHTRIDEDAALTNEDVTMLQPFMELTDLQPGCVVQEVMERYGSAEAPEDCMISRRSSLAMHHRSVSEASGHMAITAAAAVADDKWAAGNVDVGDTGVVTQPSRSGSHSSTVPGRVSRHSSHEQRSAVVSADCQPAAAVPSQNVGSAPMTGGEEPTNSSACQVMRAGSQHSLQQAGALSQEHQPLLSSSSTGPEHFAEQGLHRDSRSVSHASNSSSNKAASSIASGKAVSVAASSSTIRRSGNASTESLHMSSQGTQQPADLEGTHVQYPSLQPQPSQLSRSSSRESAAARALRQQLSQSSSRSSTGPQSTATSQLSEQQGRQCAVPLTASTQLTLSSAASTQLMPSQSTSSHRSSTAADAEQQEQLAQSIACASAADAVPTSQLVHADGATCQAVSRQLSKQDSRGRMPSESMSRQPSQSSSVQTDMMLQAVTRQLSSRHDPGTAASEVLSRQLSQSSNQGSLAVEARQRQLLSPRGAASSEVESRPRHLPQQISRESARNEAVPRQQSCSSGRHSAAAEAVQQLLQEPDACDVVNGDSTLQRMAHDHSYNAEPDVAVSQLSYASSREEHVPWQSSTDAALVTNVLRQLSQSSSAGPTTLEAVVWQLSHQGNNQAATVEAVLGELLRQHSSEHVQQVEGTHHGEGGATRTSSLHGAPGAQGGGHQHAGPAPINWTNSSGGVAVGSMQACATPATASQQASSGGGAKSGVSSSLGSGGTGTSHHLLPLLMQPGAACTTPEQPSNEAQHAPAMAVKQQHDLDGSASCTQAVREVQVMSTLQGHPVVPAAIPSAAINTMPAPGSSSSSEGSQQSEESLARFLLDLLQSLQPPSPRSPHTLPSPMPRASSTAATLAPAAAKEVQAREQGGPTSPTSATQTPPPAPSSAPAPSPSSVSETAIGKLRLSAADSLQLKALAYLLQHELSHADCPDAPAALAELLLAQAGGVVPAVTHLPAPTAVQRPAVATQYCSGGSDGSAPAVRAASTAPHTASSDSQSQTSGVVAANSAQDHAALQQSWGPSRASSGISGASGNRLSASSQQAAGECDDLQQDGVQHSAVARNTSSSSHGGLIAGPSMLTVVTSPAGTLQAQSSASQAAVTTSLTPIVHAEQQPQGVVAAAVRDLLPPGDVYSADSTEAFRGIRQALAEALSGVMDNRGTERGDDGAADGPMQALLQQLQGLDGSPTKLTSPFESVRNSRDFARTKSSGSSHSTLGGAISSMLRQGNEAGWGEPLDSCQSDKPGSDTGSMEARLNQVLHPEDNAAVDKHQQDMTGIHTQVVPLHSRTDNTVSIRGAPGINQSAVSQHLSQPVGSTAAEGPSAICASCDPPLTTVRSMPDRPIASSMSQGAPRHVGVAGVTVTVPTLSSRLSRSTSRNEPCPEGVDGPPSPQAVRAALHLPESAAALRADSLPRRRSMPHGMPPASDSATAGESMHAAHAPAKASPDSAQQPKDEVRALLQQLRQAGHHVPEHAEHVLSVIMEDDTTPTKHGPPHNPGHGVVNKQVVHQGAVPITPPHGSWASRNQLRVSPTGNAAASADAPVSPSAHSSCSSEQGSVPTSSAVSGLPDAARQSISPYERVQQLLQQRLLQRAAAAGGQAFLGAGQMDVHALAAVQSLQRTPLLPVPEKRAVSHPLNRSILTSSPLGAETGTHNAAPEVMSYAQQFVEQQQQQRGMLSMQHALHQQGQQVVVEGEAGVDMRAEGLQSALAMEEEQGAAADARGPDSSDVAPHAGPSVLEAWRKVTTRPASEHEVQQQVLLQKALQPAPSSPGRAAEVQQAALASPSPLLASPARRPASPARHSSRTAERMPPAKQASMPIKRLNSKASTASPPLAAERSQPVLGRSQSSKSAEPRRSKSVERPRGAPQAQPFAPAAASAQPLSARGAPAPMPAAALPAGSKTPGGRLAQAGSILDVVESKVSPVQPAVSVHRAFAWQERETRAWLASLGIQISPEEEEAPLLDNPVRNGVLLCELASVLTRVPVSSAVVPPKSLIDARANIMLGLDQLGLLHDMDLPPEAVGAALYPADAAAAAAQQAGSGSYSARLRARQAHAGCSVLWEVEKLLGGRRDAMWGLLNHIREMAVNKQAFLNPATHKRSARQAAARAAASMEARTEAFLAAEASIQRMLGEPNVPASMLLNAAPAGVSVALHRRSPDVAPTAAAAAAAVLNRRPVCYAPPHAGLREQEVLVLGGNTTTSRFPPTEDYGLTCMLASGVGPLHVHYGPRVLSPGRRDALLRTAAQQQQEQQMLERTAIQHAVMAEAATAALQAVEAASPHSNRAEAGTRSATRVELGGRPNWSSVRLPYHPQQLAALEASLLRWLLQMGAIDQDLAAKGFDALMAQMADGVFLCWLVQHITGLQLKGVNKKPLVEAHARANITRAIQMLRTVPNFCRRSLSHEEALLHGERSALTGLMEDLHRLADGQAPAGSVYQPGVKPYLPFAPDMSTCVPLTDAMSSMTQQLAGVSTSLSCSPLERRARPASAPRPRPPPISPPTAAPSAHDELSLPSSPCYGEAYPHGHFSDQGAECEEGQQRPWSPPGISKLFVTPTKAVPGARPPSPVPARQKVWSPPCTATVHSRPGQERGVQRDTIVSNAYRKERRAAAGIAAAPRVVTAIATAEYPRSKSISPCGAGQDLDQYLQAHQECSSVSHMSIRHGSWAGPLLRLSQQKPRF